MFFASLFIYFCLSVRPSVCLSVCLCSFLSSFLPSFLSFFISSWIRCKRTYSELSYTLSFIHDTRQTRTLLSLLLNVGNRKQGIIFLTLASSHSRPRDSEKQCETSNEIIKMHQSSSYRQYFLESKHKHEIMLCLFADSGAEDFEVLSTGETFISSVCMCNDVCTITPFII